MSEDAMSEHLQRLEGLLAAILGLQLAAARDSDEYEPLERRTIQGLHRAGFTQTMIASVLGLSQSTVSRKISE